MLVSQSVAEMFSDPTNFLAATSLSAEMLRPEFLPARSVRDGFGQLPSSTRAYHNATMLAILSPG